MVIVSSVDGGTVAIDGGIAIIAGPPGPAGAPGRSGGVTVRFLDGGIAGYLHGTDWFWDARNQCFMEANGQPPPAVQTISYESTDCSGTGYFSPNPPTIANGATPLTFRCFFIPNTSQTQFGRMAQPAVRVPFVSRSTRSANFGGCNTLAPSNEVGFTFEQLQFVGGFPTTGWILDAP